MSSHLSPSRFLVLRSLLGLALVGVLAAGWLAAYPADKEEGEPGAKKGKVVEEEEEDRPKGKALRLEEKDEEKKAAPVREVELKRAAREAKHFAVRKLFTDLAVPHDVVNLKGFSVAVGGERTAAKQVLVEPIAELITNPRDVEGKLTLNVITLAGKRQRTLRLEGTFIASIRYYEQTALQAVKEFLDSGLDRLDPASNRHLSRYDQLVAADQALSAVLRFLKSARLRDVRRGTAWNGVEKELQAKLLDINLGLLGELTDAKQWDQGFNLTRRLAETYQEPAAHVRIGKALERLLSGAMKDPTAAEATQRKMRQRLRQLEDLFPGSAVITPITGRLKKNAEDLFERAKDLLKKDKDKEPQALELLRQAEELWADLPGLRLARLELERSYQELRVAVRELPEFLSPALAWTDTEKRCVEMLFESLVQQVPDRDGALFHRPALAQGRPRVIPLGREFRLPRAARWSDGLELTVGDLRFTVARLQNKIRRERAQISERPHVWGELIDKVSVGGDPYRVKVLLNQGYIDPLALMSFKLLPARTNPNPAEPRFARKPIGSGPYRYMGKGSKNGREFAHFVANPYYGARADKRNLPYIREIHLFASPDPGGELEKGRVDLALDLSAEQAAALQKDKAGRYALRLPGENTANRRIYFLAMNHRTPGLDNASLRIALARAIDRESLLNAHFRGSLLRKVHRALNGPYPAGSWACDPKLHSRKDESSLDLYDPALARTKLREAQSRPALKKLTLKLLYPSGNPELARAMEELCRQVTNTLEGVTLQPEAKTPRELHEAVEGGIYELAYYHYDFPDETFWLKPLLGPSNVNGENYLSYTGPLVEKIDEAMRLRQFAKVREYAHAIHRQFLMSEMPFVPLWQLDPLVAYRKKDLEVVPFDPLLVFSTVESWRVTRGE
jgi:ABC-type oligopeptide transport system substrate-binding subunit